MIIMKSRMLSHCKEKYAVAALRIKPIIDESLEFGWLNRVSHRVSLYRSRS